MIWQVIITVLMMFAVITSFGYILHWSLHQRWAGRFFRPHMVHHQKLYSSSQFLSDKYLDPGKDNTVIIFVAAGLPIILAPVILLALHIIGWTVFITAMISMAIIGIPHDYLHDQFHLRYSWLRRFGWFEKLTDIHKVHHIDMTKNYGIYWFGWDRVFGSFRKK